MDVRAVGAAASRRYTGYTPCRAAWDAWRLWAGGWRRYMGPAVREVKAGEVTKFVKKPHLAAVGAFASKDSSEYSRPSSPVVSPQPQPVNPS